MRVRAKRREGESLVQFLRRFSTRVQRSGIVTETKRRSVRRKVLNEREQHAFRLYRLKLQQFIEQKMKEGSSFDKAHQMGRRYLSQIKYKG